MPPAPRYLAEETLLSMLLPVWQLAIGLCVVLAIAVSALRLARRGRSRMTTAIMVTGTAVVGLTALALLFI